MAHLMDLPEELLEGSILPFLPWNDLLRCRRLCKVIKRVTENYIRIHPEKAKAPEIEVTEQTGKDLKAFLAMGIPTTKLFLNNPTGHHFYDNLDTATLAKFTTTYGPIIASLRVVELSVYPCFNEWTFLESLTNLKTFEAGCYGLGVDPPVREMMMFQLQQFMHSRMDPRVPRDDPFIYPQNFKNLEVLKIGHTKQICIGFCSKELGEFLKNLPKLGYISFPFCAPVDERNLADDEEYIESELNSFTNVLQKITTSISGASNAEEQKHLKFFDFICYHKERGMKIEVIDELYVHRTLEFLVFTEACTAFGVKLLNVNPAWYIHPHGNQNGVPVVSLVNLHACVSSLDMPHLERINICQTSRSNVDTWVDRPNWPALKTLEINVNSKKAVETEMPGQDTALLFKFLWKDVVREQLIEISLKFQDEKAKGWLAIPMTEDIVNACPNLRKLRLENWPGTNKQLTKLWSGLPGLEELALDYCKNLGNVAFVGEDVENPVFFQLKNLKKLSLKGLDQMPKITDTLFTLVLAKMNLKHLIISSDKPLEKITKVGITALLEGNFAETIEKFPCHGWSLANMSAEELEHISKQFRSYNML